MDAPRIALCAALATLAGSAPAQAYEVLPLRLPSPARAASAQTWLVGARPGADTTAAATRFGAFARGRAYVVAASRARGLAGALRAAGALRYSEPNPTLRRASSRDTQLGGWARGEVISPALPAPAPAVFVGIVDDTVDAATPDVGPQTRFANARPVASPHGTMVASTISGALNGTGVTGAFPSVPLLSYGTDLSCADVAAGIDALVAQGAKIVNLSLGMAEDCFTLFVAVEAAYGAGTLIVASAGNEFQEGNPIVYPAAFPHVLSVGSIGPDEQPSYFSNANAAVDVAAPGEQVPVAIPLGFDTADGVPDGVTLADGTSFSSPIAAGAAAWVWSARPDLRNGQVADILRISAKDVLTPGYDASTGYGVVNVDRAVTTPAPLEDPLEPNDDIPFINGVAFRSPDPLLWNGVGRKAVRASADRVEDPYDVYRVRVPRHARVEIAVMPRYGDVDLRVLAAGSETLARGRTIARSRHSGRRVDSAVLVNDGAAATVYVAIEPAARSATLDAGYTLRFRRLVYR